MNRSIAFRRSFTTHRAFATTTCRLRPSDGKPPPQERNDPPPPNDSNPNENHPQDADEKKKHELQRVKSGFRETIVGTFKPRSEHFIFAFANPRLSKDVRIKQFLLLLAATLMATLTEPYFQKAVLGEKEATGEQDVFLDLVANASANQNKTEDSKTNH